MAVIPDCESASKTDPFLECKIDPFMALLAILEGREKMAIVDLRLGIIDPTHGGVLLQPLVEPLWTCPGKVESFPHMRGELDDQAEAVPDDLRQ